MQNSFKITGCYVNGDNCFNKDQENVKKSDLILDKKSALLSTVLPHGHENKLIKIDRERRKNYNKRTSKKLRKQASVANNKNLIEEKKSTGFQKCMLETFPSRTKVQDSFKLKSSTSFESPNYNLLKEQTKSKNTIQEYNEINLVLKEKFHDSLAIVENRSSKVYLKNIDKEENISEHKLKNVNNNYTETDKILKIFTPSNDVSNSSSCSSFSDKLLLKTSELKYSWQDINSWLSPSQKEEINEKQKSFDCKKTYSWEYVGIGTQISNQFLQNDVNYKNSTHKCTVKYSWQIIGKNTQVSLNDCEDDLILNSDYWEGSIISPRKNCGSLKEPELPAKCLKPPHEVRILYCERTQTASDKKTQTELTNCPKKYSWENLIKQHLDSFAMARNSVKKLSYDNEHSRKLANPINCSTKYSWENLINLHMKNM